MDKAVAAAYGWGDLDLGRGFHETKQGVRFTIGEAARREVLGRLLKLNHERYAEEVSKGCTTRRAKAKSPADANARLPTKLKANRSTATKTTNPNPPRTRMPNLLRHAKRAPATNGKT